MRKLERPSWVPFKIWKSEAAKAVHSRWCWLWVDKLAKDKNGVKYLIVRQDLFHGTVDAKGMKTKNSKETVQAFLTMITKKGRHKKIWVDKGIKFAGEFKKLCKAEAIQIYSTMSETKSAFAERTIRSLNCTIYFTITWKTVDTSKFTNWLNWLQHQILEKIAR